MLQPVEVLAPEGIEREPEEAAPLPNEWESNVYQLSRSAAAELGFAVGSVKGSRNTRLLVMDTARARTQRFPDRDGRFRTEQWGCGYRLIIEVSDISLVARLSLPAIAASVELKNAEASVSLKVKGYKGDDLWNVIPPPAPLDVDSYKRYLEAGANIQQRFQDHPKNQEVVLLARSEGEFDVLIDGISERDLLSAALIVRSLEHMARGTPLEEALGGFTGPDEQRKLVEHTYRAIRGDAYDSSERLSNEERQASKKHLEKASR